MTIRRAILFFGALAPSVAHANLSHLAGGGVTFLLVLVGAIFLVPPLVAARLVRKGPRIGRYSLAFATWLSMLVVVYFAYASVPFQTRSQHSAMVFPCIIAFTFLIYVGGALALRRWLTSTQREATPMVMSNNDIDRVMHKEQVTARNGHPMRRKQTSPPRAQSRLVFEVDRFSEESRP